MKKSLHCRLFFAFLCPNSQTVGCPSTHPPSSVGRILVSDKTPHASTIPNHCNHAKPSDSRIRPTTSNSRNPRWPPHKHQFHTSHNGRLQTPIPSLTRVGRILVSDKPLNSSAIFKTLQPCQTVGFKNPTYNAKFTQPALAAPQTPISSLTHVGRILVSDKTPHAPVIFKSLHPCQTVGFKNPTYIVACALPTTPERQCTKFNRQYLNLSSLRVWLYVDKTRAI